MMSILKPPSLENKEIVNLSPSGRNREKQMKKRLQKKLTKRFLSFLICGPIERPFVVAWSPSWRGALQSDDLAHIRKTTRFRRYTKSGTSCRNVIELDGFLEKTEQSAGPVLSIPVHKLPPEKVLRGDGILRDERYWGVAC